ncbi:hypothetical protein S245_020664, partial [Arachis hypogaea]
PTNSNNHPLIQKLPPLPLLKKKTLSSSLFSHLCDPDFWTTLPSIAVARLCSLITAAHYLFITAGLYN